MPMHRYEIRDEYSLADPELYRAADKDDPEALLEGVAMAGMVGLLRQLGDLAEFAAEIFHDLHEEVMVTAARGHGLMIRVQQLEAEIPSIEKAFLSQTDLSPFFYNAGVDWHANLPLHQNLTTQGDLPRFVMDSYEECRGPPRLFLLDKFDVAGAGACLKRYTDPSFFKVETSATATAAAHREKKSRKAKKKGPRGRYGETPETLQVTSHAKLHQLLLDESLENGVTKPAYRARLKRRPSGFPINSNFGKSYMEELLKNSSPEHKMLQEITVSSSLMPKDDQNESVLELRSVSPSRESEWRRSNPPFIGREEIMSNHASVDIKTYGVSSYLNILTDGVPSTSDGETSGKDITIDGEGKIGGSLIGYQSDEIASEIDNYVDAPSTMESEMDTDSELRVKNDSTSCIKNESLVSVGNQEHNYTQSLDSVSTGGCSVSDEGNNSYKKEMSSFLSSDSTRTSVENSQLEQISADGPEFVIVQASSSERAPELVPADISKSVVSKNTFPDKDSAPENRPDFEESASDPTLPHYDPREISGEVSIRRDKLDGAVSNSDDDEKKSYLIFDSPCLPSASHSKLLEDVSKRSSSGEFPVGREIPWVSTRTGIVHHTSDSSNAISVDLAHEDEFDQKEVNEFANKASTMNMDNIISQNINGTEEIAPEENPNVGNLSNEIAELTDNFSNDYADIVCNGDKVAPEVSEGDAGDQSNLFNDPKVVFETLDSEDSCSNNSDVNQIRADALMLSGIEHPPVLLDAGGIHDSDFAPEGPTTINGTSEPGYPETSDVLGLQIGKTDDVNPNGLTSLGSPFCTPENFENSSGILYTAEKDVIDPDNGIAGLQLTEISSSSSVKVMSQVPESSDELDPSTDQSENARLACSIPDLPDDPIQENISSPAGFGELVEEHAPCFLDLGLDVLENDMTSLSGFNEEPEVEEEKSNLSGSHRESGLVEEVDERDAAALDFAAVHRMQHDGHPKPEVWHDNVTSFLDSEVKQKVDMINASRVLTPVEQSGLDTEEESFQHSGLENQVSGVDSLHIDFVAEESISSENVEVPSTPIDNELPDSSATICSELSSVLPTSQLQMLDHDDDKGNCNFASSFPPPDHPLSVSVVLGPSDYGTDASAYPKDTSGLMFPAGNPFPGINQTSQHQSPSLPPLPPLQWRIGKLQHASSTTEVDKMELKEVFPQPIFPPMTSAENVSSMPEQTKLSPAQSPHITIQENLEQGCPSHEIISLPTKVENEKEEPQQQPLNPIRDSEVPSASEEDGVSEGSQTVRLPVEIVPESSFKEENADQDSPTLEASSRHQAVDPPPEVGKKQQQLHLVLHVEDSEIPPPAAEDGVAVSNGSRTMKLPRSCNPVIGSVAALDKSRLRKVTEQVRPQMPKQDERDALLDQIRAKSFNLKPTATSRPSVQAPNTNLKLTAILEKANAIRQALAGSDEDDEDNWSDE